jgi:tetratricopeptide (TPR) repeat protein
VRRQAVLLIAITWAAMADSPPRMDGEALFREAEFKAAARWFERALINEPASARCHYWAGKSYAHLAEISAPWSARRNARKAQAHLEAAVRLDPKNRLLLTELFESYVDSPEWFDGGLDRARAIVERLGPDDGGPGSPSRILAETRSEYSSAGWGWAVRKGILRFSGTIGAVAH